MAKACASKFSSNKIGNVSEKKDNDNKSYSTNSGGLKSESKL